jgi:hypothetical protein
VLLNLPLAHTVVVLDRSLIVPSQPGVLQLGEKVVQHMLVVMFIWELVQGTKQGSVLQSLPSTYAPLAVASPFNLKLIRAASIVSEGSGVPTGFDTPPWQ